MTADGNGAFRAGRRCQSPRYPAGASAVCAPPRQETHRFHFVPPFPRPPTGRPPTHDSMIARRDPMKKWLPGALLLGIACLPLAQDWPVAKPIRLIVAYPAGGVSDQMARALA